MALEENVCTSQRRHKNVKQRKSYDFPFTCVYSFIKEHWKWDTGRSSVSGVQEIQVTVVKSESHRL